MWETSDLYTTFTSCRCCTSEQMVLLLFSRLQANEVVINSKEQRPCEVLTVIPLIITLPVSCALEDFYCVYKSPCH
jgi:hypothetical protein